MVVATAPIGRIGSEGSRFALGIGLPTECTLACGFCYRDPTRVDRLSLDQVRAVLERLPVRSVNLGTGENGMHPGFTDMLFYLRKQPVKLTITSNGRSLQMLDDRDVTAFADVEFSLDYPNEREQDLQRGGGNWRLVHEQAARCRRLGVSVTFIAVMMRSNFDRMADIAKLAKQYDAPLRINVYQAVRSDAFSLRYEEYWTGCTRVVWPRLRAPVRAARRHCHRRAPGARHGRAPAAPRRLRRCHRARHAAG